MHTKAFLRLSLAASIALLCWSVCWPVSIAAAEDEAADTGFERFYLMEMAGQRVGWAVEQQTRIGGLWVTESWTRMELMRAGTQSTVEMYSRFEETADHRPLAGMTRQTLGATPIETLFRFQDGEVLVQQPGGEARSRPLPQQGWMTPAAATQRTSRQVQRAYSQAEGGEAPEFAFEVSRVDLLTGLDPVTSRMVLQDVDDSVTIDGASRDAGLWALSESYAPGIVSRAWFDRRGVLLRTEAEMMGTTVVMTLTANDPRLGGPESDGDGSQDAELPELLIQNFVRPSRPLDSPRTLRRAVYRLQADGIDLAPIVPSLGVQTARAEGDDLRVTIDLDASSETESSAEPVDEFLETNRFVDFDNPAVQAMIESWRAASDASTSATLEPAAKAESLRRLVAGHLNDKNLGTVLGSASEAATTGAGDCTEHAVLLAALLRAENLPSRVAVGLVYAENFAGERDIFAYHMWTQALLALNGGARWVDLDATLPGDIPFDATHILFATSSLSGDGVPLIGTGVETIFGLLSIEVVSTGADAGI